MKGFHNNFKNIPDLKKNQMHFKSFNKRTKGIGESKNFWQDGFFENLIYEQLVLFHRMQKYQLTFKI